MLKGLAVRWSLTDSAADAAQQLRDYVADASHARFEGKAGLRFKTWRMRAGEWFEGTYVFESDDERAAFEDAFTPGADDSPVSQIVGSGPVLIEPFEVAGVAEGGAGFVSAPRG